MDFVLERCAWVADAKRSSNEPAAAGGAFLAGTEVKTESLGAMGEISGIDQDLAAVAAGAVAGDVPGSNAGVVPAARIFSMTLAMKVRSVGLLNSEMTLVTCSGSMAWR